MNKKTLFKIIDRELEDISKRIDQMIILLKESGCKNETFN